MVRDCRVSRIPIIDVTDSTVSRGFKVLADRQAGESTVRIVTAGAGIVHLWVVLID